jgi:acyl-CoA dehydrogenase
MRTDSDALHSEIREAVRSVCGRFPPAYHRAVDEKKAYPQEFVDALTKAG